MHNSFGLELRIVSLLKTAVRHGSWSVMHIILRTFTYICKYVYARITRTYDFVGVYYANTYAWTTHAKCTVSCAREKTYGLAICNIRYLYIYIYIECSLLAIVILLGNSLSFARWSQSLLHSIFIRKKLYPINKLYSKCDCFIKFMLFVSWPIINFVLKIVRTLRSKNVVDG